MSLYDILACPVCKVGVVKESDRLHCGQCQRTYPVVNGVPVMFPKGTVPQIVHETDLLLRTAYNPRVHRTILQSLLDNHI